MFLFKLLGCASLLYAAFGLPTDPPGTPRRIELSTTAVASATTAESQIGHAAELEARQLDKRGRSTSSLARPS
jgi:type IV secretory pathway TrbL component